LFLGDGVEDEAISLNGLADILQFTGADGDGLDIQAMLDQIVDGLGDADSVRFGFAEESGGDVDAIAKNIALAEEDVAEMNADAVVEDFFRREALAGLGDDALDFNGAGDGRLDAVERGQAAIAGVLKDFAAEFPTDFADEFEIALDEQEGLRFVLFDQAAEAGDVSEDDGRQALVAE
jgi:hypothetical protein